MDRIYLDHAATSPLSPEARAAMIPWLDAGNPSSLHADGRRARAAVDEARESVSARLGVEFAECLFTSGGTESANAAILGLALEHLGGPRRRVLLGSAEHHAVLATRRALEAMGFRVELLPVDRFGRVDPDDLSARLAEDVLLVSVMHANNELGTVQAVPELVRRSHAAGARFHSDAVQTLGHLGDWRADDLGADLITASAHKVGGPKGVGLLVVRAGTKLAPHVAGGGQEREVRGGTENVAGIVGFATALRAFALSPERRLARDRFLARLEAAGAVRTVPAEVPALPGHAHVRFPGLDAETALIRLDREGVSASSGAACSSGSLEPSHVLLACGYPEAEAKEGLRFTFGPRATLDEADRAADRVIGTVVQIRESGKRVRS